MSLICLAFSLLAAYGSYDNFFSKVRCTYGGSKLSWFFGIICESFGVIGVATLWLVLSLISFVYGMRALMKFIKYSK